MAVSQDFGGLWVVHRRESWRTMSRYRSAFSEVWVRPWPPLCTQHKWQTNRSQPSYGVCGWPLFQSKGEVTICIFPAQCVAKILSKKGRNWTSMFKWQQTHDCVRTSCSKCTGSLTDSHQVIHDLRCPWDALHHYGPSLANDRIYFRWCDWNRNKWRQNVEKKISKFCSLQVSLHWTIGCKATNPDRNWSRKFFNLSCFLAECCLFQLPRLWHVHGFKSQLLTQSFFFGSLFPWIRIEGHTTSTTGKELGLLFPVVSQRLRVWILWQEKIPFLSKKPL